MELSYKPLELVRVGCVVADTLCRVVPAGYIASRAVRNGASDVCAAATEVIIPLLADDIDLPQTARMNAAYCSVSLAQQKEFATEGSRRALSDALAAASEDDDRYVIAAVRS